MKTTTPDRFPFVKFERISDDSVPAYLYWETIRINGQFVGVICRNMLLGEGDDYTLTISDYSNGRSWRRHVSHHQTVSEAKAAFFGLPAAVVLGRVG